ncbi:YbaB/EbfC family nucleoid-associated protein [Gordonia sp. CPCC 206044]|uniref:YbaB/EbfC family nucleoid-associated protein n=1 Tax=Gordonia sp. CPCC 206044 TaxID=3140793 RepID=UPI003AF35242
MDELEARARRQLDSLTEVNERLGRIVASETSPNGEVRAEVDGMGALVDLKLSDRVGGLSGKQLEQLIVATANVACQKAFAQRAKVMEEFSEEFAGLVAAPGAHDDSRNDGGDG